MRRMQTWGSELSSSSTRSRSKEKLQRSAPRPPSENKLKACTLHFGPPWLAVLDLSEVTAPHPLPGGIAADVDEVDAGRVFWGPHEGTQPKRLTLLLHFRAEESVGGMELVPEGLPAPMVAAAWEHPESGT